MLCVYVIYTELGHARPRTTCAIASLYLSIRIVCYIYILQISASHYIYISILFTIYT